MRQLFSVYITGLGSYLPERVLSNRDLEAMVETSDEWIVSRTGMKERRIAAAEEFPSDMGAKAALKALQSANVAPEEIDLLIVATMSPDYITPSTAGLIQAQIGAVRAVSFDLQAACTGFLYALATAKAFLQSGIYKNALVVATEKMSAFMDYQDRSTCVLFGDGAAAAFLTLSDRGLRVDAISLGADGRLADLISIPGGGSRHPASPDTLAKRLHYFKMSGNEVYKHAVRKMGGAVRECLAQAELTEEQISWLIPHQANIRIINALAKDFQLDQARVYKTLEKYGNTSASGIAIALDELIQQEKVEEGAHLLLTAFGGGLTWGAALLTQVGMSRGSF